MLADVVRPTYPSTALRISCSPTQARRERCPTRRRGWKKLMISSTSSRPPRRQQYSNDLFRCHSRLQSVESRHVRRARVVLTSAQYCRFPSHGAHAQMPTPARAARRSGRPNISADLQDDVGTSASRQPAGYAFPPRAGATHRTHPEARAPRDQQCDARSRDQVFDRLRYQDLPRLGEVINACRDVDADPG